MEVQARAWRLDFLGPVIMGLRAPLDPVLAYVVKELYPAGKMPAPTEAHGSEPMVHIYDAVAGGMTCLAKQLGLRLTLPKRILDGAYKVALEEKAKRTTRRAAKKLGVKLPGERRHLSSNQQKQANVKRKATIARNKKVNAG